MKNFKYLLLLILIYLSSCSILGDFESPEVISFSPPRDSVNVDRNSSIIIIFSEPMEKPITERAFSLETSSGSISGYFKWEDKDRKMIFTPEYPLDSGKIFYVNLTKDAEDKNGNNLAEQLSYKFTVSGETVKPYVVSTYPNYGAIGIPKSTNIIITFSEPIDNSSLIDGVSFSPSFNYQLLMANNNTVAIFDPVEYLEYGTTYLVTINQNVKDIEGNPLLQEYTFVFTVGDDFTKPVLISVRNSSSTNLWSESDINEYVEKDDTIVFVFSKQMNKNNIEAYISFSPSVEGSFTWNNDYQLSFTPNDIFDILEVYNVNISESLSDINGNELEQSYSFKFKINGTDSLPPEVIKISSPDSTNWQNNQFINIMTDGSNVFYTNIQIHFSHPMHQIKVINNLSVEYIGGSGSSGVQIIKYIWNSPSDTILRIDLNGLDSGNFYELKIKGEKDGATDKKNNYLLEDYIIYFKT